MIFRVKLSKNVGQSGFFVSFGDFGEYLSQVLTTIFLQSCEFMGDFHHSEGVFEGFAQNMGEGAEMLAEVGLLNGHEIMMK